MRDFDENEFPLAYLITFRCYGTWVHGDERGSMDRRASETVDPARQYDLSLERARCGDSDRVCTVGARRRSLSTR